MLNLRTTISGIVVGVSQLLKLVGLDIPVPVLDVITAVGIMVAFYFAKDK